MKNLIIISFVALLGGLVVGCEPAPSTPLAPEVKLPDVNKMSSEDLAKLKQQSHEGGRR